MKQRRGFTLVEIMIVLAIISILFIPFTTMADRLVDAYERSIHKLENRNEFQGLGYRLQALLRAHPDYKIKPDNKGATWSGGSIQWDGAKVSVTLPQGVQNLEKDISHFSLHRRDGRTYLTLIGGKASSSNRILLQVEDDNA